ncbi:MAG: ankyrin repeat domain protein [Verrucomicrobiales bacterium]|nr:ankyrin repeat domain protein [Verrucomicrobiales bacterium]
MNHEKCCCGECGQNIEYHLKVKGQTIQCPTCDQPVMLMPTNQPIQKRRKAPRQARTKLAELTAQTIRSQIKTGDTPVHRAAKDGKIYEIPRHLLQVELFFVKNNSEETPIHMAAKNGHLDQIPREFLTKETLTVSTEYPHNLSKTGTTPPFSETPLHVAARCGHIDQIPKEFLTPEFLSIEATGYRLTVLHCLAYSNRLDVVPAIYATSEIWNLRNSKGETPRQIVANKIDREAFVANVRNEPATEKQKEKLRYFNCPWKEDITKGQASDAIDECVKRFPDVNRAYYNRPAAEEQLAKLEIYFRRKGGVPDDYADAGKPLTYRQAKDLIWECENDVLIEKREKEYQKMKGDILIDLVARTDFYPGLTRKRAKEAAKLLDETQIGWRDDRDAQNVLLKTVAELYPELAAKESWL